MSRYFFIDSENVGDFWVSLLPSVNPEDLFLVFYTLKSPYMNYKNLILLKESDKDITFIECTGGKNALDFQLCTDLGYRIHDDRDGEYIIVSSDTGYDAVIRYWAQRDITICRIPKPGTAEKKTSSAREKETAGKQNTAQKAGYVKTEKPEAKTPEQKAEKQDRKKPAEQTEKQDAKTPEQKAEKQDRKKPAEQTEKQEVKASEQKAEKQDAKAPEQKAETEVQPEQKRSSRNRKKKKNTADGTAENTEAAVIAAEAPETVKEEASEPVEPAEEIPVRSEAVTAESDKAEDAAEPAPEEKKPEAPKNSIEAVLKALSAGTAQTQAADTEAQPVEAPAEDTKTAVSEEQPAEAEEKAETENVKPSEASEEKNEAPEQKAEAVPAEETGKSSKAKKNAEKKNSGKKSSKKEASDESASVKEEAEKKTSAKKDPANKTSEKKPKAEPEKHQEESESSNVPVIDDAAKEILYCIGREHLADLYESLKQVYGEKRCKSIYNSFKSENAFSTFLTKHEALDAEGKQLLYIRTVFAAAEIAVPETLPQFVLEAWNKKKNLNSFHAALRSEYGEENGKMYYSRLKGHVKIMAQIS